MYLKEHDYARSREHILPAIDLFRKQQDRLNEAAALGMLSRAELGGGGELPAAGESLM